MSSVTFVIKCFSEIWKVPDAIEVKTKVLSDKVSERPSTPIPDAFNSLGYTPEGLAFNPEDMVTELLRGY